MYLLAVINTTYFCHMRREKYFAALRLMYLFIKSFANHFVDVSLTFSDSSSNLLLASTLFFI